MSFDKNYPNRKDWRKPYRKSKAWDRTCRNHGACSYCENNRLYKARREDITMREQYNIGYSWGINQKRVIDEAQRRLQKSFKLFSVCVDKINDEATCESDFESSVERLIDDTLYWEDKW